MKKARTVFVITLGLNFLVAFSKLGWGFYTGALSLAADGFHSLLDGSSNVVGIIGLTVSMRPPDHDHPYGHRKFEALGSIIISFFMFLACFEVVTEAFKRFTSPELTLPEVNFVSYGVMVVTMLINIFVTTYETRKGKELRSKILLADAKHTLSDLFVSGTVIASLVAIQFKLPIVDLIGSLVIVCFILYAGFEIIMSQIGALVDEAVFDPATIEALVMQVPGVTSCHKIRSRGMEDNVFIDLHVQVPRTLTIEQAHDIAFRVEADLKSALRGVTEVLVHLEDDAPPVETHKEIPDAVTQDQ